MIPFDAPVLCMIKSVTEHILLTRALESHQNTTLSKVILHSAHALWTKGNLIRSTGEIEPELVCSPCKKTLKFSSKLYAWAKARITSPSSEISVSP